MTAARGSRCHKVDRFAPSAGIDLSLHDLDAKTNAGNTCLDTVGWMPEKENVLASIEVPRRMPEQMA
jgi:hypothetical protein